MPTSVRLDAETEALLRRLARERGASKSDVIRDALQELAAASGETEAAGPYAQVADLLGIVKGKPVANARDHKRVVRELMNKKRNARHAG